MAWTLADAQSKREEILKSIGITRQQFGDRSVEYSDQVKALAAIDAEIARLSGSSTGTSMCTVASYSRD